MSLSPREVFLRLVHGVADGNSSELPDLYGEVTDVRHPMATPESEPLTSRRALREHFTVPPEVRESLPKRSVVDVVVHETADPEVIVAEFAYEFTLPDDSMPEVPLRVGRVVNCMSDLGVCLCWSATPTPKLAVGRIWGE
ncbi:hypothetical protein [Streptomyces sp. NPDC051554]|uniref:hypothetical protein n=1 Tax=Streptomyces sp. NPDC051554 TaxID=3365656 RepID=UPI0037A28486